MGLAYWTAPASPAFPGANGHVAFERFPLGGCSKCHHQIYVASRSGTGVRALTHTATDKFSPAYSADGRKVAFAEVRVDLPQGFSHISVIDSVGEHHRRLTDSNADDGHPAFRPDGRRIAFARRRNDISIYSIKTDGTGSRRLTSNGMSPSFSPDGRRIVFEGWKGDERGIFVMHADGSHRHQLTHDPLSEPDPLGNRDYLHVDRSPSFGPQGNSIIFLRTFGGCTGGDVYVMRADGTRAHDLTPHAGGTCNPYTDPTFSPDGRRIVFVGASYLFVMSRHDANRHIVTQKSALYGGPTWQPVPRDDDRLAR